MDAECTGVHEHKDGLKDSVDSPQVTTSFLRHPMGDTTSPRMVLYRDVSSPQMVSSPQVASPQFSSPQFSSPSSPSMASPSPQINKQISSPIFPASPRQRGISSPVFPTSPKQRGGLFKEISSPAVLKRERSNSIFQRERSNSVFKTEKGHTMTKLGFKRRQELEHFLQHRGFSAEELDSIVNQFHDIREKLEDGEWVTRGEFKKFIGVREQALSDSLFDVFKQRHKMHNFEDLDFCPSPQMSREKPVGDDGVEMDAINLREFLCGLLLLQSNDVDKKLRMVFDLYNNAGDAITKDNLKAILLTSAKENKITLTDEQFDTVVDRIFSKMDTSATGLIRFEDFKTAFQEIPLALEQRSQRTPLTEFLSINTTSPPSPMKPFSWTMSVDDLKQQQDGDIGMAHPDFVDHVYDEEDPKRSKHKQKNFENQVKANIFPQQEPKPKKKAKANRQIRTKIHASGSKYVFLGIFVLVNLGFFAWQFLLYGLNAAVIDRLGWGVPFARGFAQILKIDTVILLIPISRSVLTYVRATPLRRFVPLDKNLSFHKLVAATVLLASVGHWGAHLANFYYISTASLAELQSINPSYFTEVPSYLALNFLTIPGITGYVMLVSLAIIFFMATKRVRKHSFEKFYSMHHFFVLFYAACILHGASHILGPYEYWKWIMGPAAIYIFERCVRLYKLRRNVKVREAAILPDRAVMLKMELPSRRLNYKAGQYIFINFPTISKFEWHPFTLTSAPHEDFLSVHIRAAGNWTNKVYNLCESAKGNTPNFTVNIDGPYGSASEHVFAYKHAIMIGAGIGVTPFASVLKRLLHRLETEQGTKKVEKIHFFWTCREQGAFQWFADILSKLEAHKDAKDHLEINTFLTGALAQHDIRSILLWYGLQQEYASSSKDLVTGLSSRTYWGRPNFERIFEYLFQQYPKEKVGIFFCGPQAMAHDLKASCKKHASLNGSTFHFHQEVF